MKKENDEHLCIYIIFPFWLRLNDAIQPTTGIVHCEPLLVHFGAVSSAQTKALLLIE